MKRVKFKAGDIVVYRFTTAAPIVENYRLCLQDESNNEVLVKYLSTLFYDDSYNDSDFYVLVTSIFREIVLGTD